MYYNLWFAESATTSKLPCDVVFSARQNSLSGSCCIWRLSVWHLVVSFQCARYTDTVEAPPERSLRVISTLKTQAKVQRHFAGIPTSNVTSSKEPIVVKNTDKAVGVITSCTK